MNLEGKGKWSYFWGDKILTKYRRVFGKSGRQLGDREIAEGLEEHQGFREDAETMDFNQGRSEDFDQENWEMAKKAFEESEGRAPNINDPRECGVVAAVQLGIAYYRKIRED